MKEFDNTDRKFQDLGLRYASQDRFVELKESTELGMRMQEEINEWT